MTDQEISLITLYRGWEDHQQRLADLIASLSVEQLTWRGAPHLWSIGQITAHVVAARVWWFHARMGEGSADLAPLEHWDRSSAPLRQANELVDGLKATWSMITTSLTNVTLADLEDVFPARSDDLVERTRGWIVWHVIEHDIHHTGEMSVILGMHGLATTGLM
jgi:uncharacterized damage-inducible protein DinB